MLGGRDLRLHVADDELGRRMLSRSDAPRPLSLRWPLLLDLDRVELQALGVGVGGVDDAAAARASARRGRGGARS